MHLLSALACEVSVVLYCIVMRWFWLQEEGEMAKHHSRIRDNDWQKTVEAIFGRDGNIEGYCYLFDCASHL